MDTSDGGQEKIVDSNETKEELAVNGNTKSENEVEVSKDLKNDNMSVDNSCEQLNDNNKDTSDDKNMPNESNKDSSEDLKMDIAVPEGSAQNDNNVTDDNSNVPAEEPNEKNPSSINNEEVSDVQENVQSEEPAPVGTESCNEPAMKMEVDTNENVSDPTDGKVAETSPEENKSFKVEEGEEEFKGFPAVTEELQSQEVVKTLQQKEENELQEMEVFVSKAPEGMLSPSSKRKRKDVEESDLSSHCSSPALSVASQLSVLSFTKRSRTGSPASRGSRKSTIDLSNPKYLVPFEFGWKREVVTRAITSREDGISKDVYYFHPSGKKLRSLREVSEKMTPGLTIENFTFYKEPLGADPQFETIRNARTRGFSPLELTAPKPFTSPAARARLEKASAEPTPAKETSSTDPSPAKDSPKPMPLRNFVKTPKEPAAKPPPAKREKLVLKFNKGTPKIALKKSPAAVNGDRKSPKMIIPKLEGPKPHPNAPSGPKRKITPRKKSLKPQNNNKEDGRGLGKGEGGDLEMGMLPPLWSPNGGSNKSSSNESLSWSHLDEENYSALLNVFQYLKVQELLRAGRVCRLWRDLASHSSLWRTVRMKNSQVSDWKGFTDSLSRHGTRHLDLRKMLMSLDDAEEMWAMFATYISTVKCLERLDMCRCSVDVVLQIMEACPHLLVFNAQMIGVKDQVSNQKLSLQRVPLMKNLRELRLKSFFGLHLTGSLESLTELSGTLKTLSLTSVKNLNTCDIHYIGQLPNLEALELGECSELPETFPTDVIAKLTNLRRIRLEKGPWNNSTNEMIYQMSKLKSLIQLELINFDVRPGFEKALASCTNIKRLLLIPTYVTQSATTNNIILSGTFKLWKNLTHFVWVVTMELLKVTELFVDQCEGKGSRKSGGNSVPVLKPVPLPAVRINQKEPEPPKEENETAGKSPTPITVIPIDELFIMLTQALPTTRVKLLKIPFQNTWRQSLSEGSSY